MKKILTSPENLKADIRQFYNETQHHFIVMNAVEMGEQMEIQWFFCDYAHPAEMTCFYMQIPPGTLIPTITGVVSSAWVAEAELSDLMNVDIENTGKGFVLEPDSEAGPLRKKK